MKLLIAIPALNEEDSIENIIERSLTARDHILKNSLVTAVAITVVSDGSTDRTVERANKYAGRINLIVFPENQGYGAAIKEAWRQSDADILGFLDADGTCDPKFFAQLCTALESKGADVVLGCRLNKHSRMPLIRRSGNLLFALILSVFSSSKVRDTASGMRVVRRTSLNRLLPLPDGLHFTPAMSARAMLCGNLRIVDIDIPYHERAGKSKLRIATDGLHFLKVIVEAAFLYRPSRPLGLVALTLFLGAWILMLGPIRNYLHHRSVAEWMIYRFLVSDLAATTACLCFCASYLTGRMVSIALSDELSPRKRKWTEAFFHSSWFWIVPLLFVIVGASLVLASFLDLVSKGATYEHWSRYVVMSFCFLVAIILSVTRGIDYVLELVEQRVSYFRLSSPENIGQNHLTASK